MKAQKSAYGQVGMGVDQPLLLDCPACHSFISQGDINEQKSIASCSHCDHVFQIDDAENWDPFGPSLSAQPTGIEVLRLRSMLELRIKHLQSVDRKELGFLAFFSLLWNGALLPFVFNIISSGTWILLLFISVHLVAGISMLWYLLTSIFNTTSIDVTKQQVRISTSPITLPGTNEVIIQTPEIDQLFVSTTKTNSPGGNYGLYLLMKNGKKIKLLDKLNRTTLMQIEQEIEKYLEISDRPVH
ncbi:MAG: hypothetical protein HKN87_17505 [Saprospiraceae bacterium]|nr:hypothetical protein [Saprospiraceae bacterium]